MTHGAKASTAIECKTDGDVLDGLLNVLPSHQLAFGRFMGLANALGWVTPKETADQSTSLGATVTAASVGCGGPACTGACASVDIVKYASEEGTRCVAATHRAGDIYGPFRSALHVAFECAQERI